MKLDWIEQIATKHWYEWEMFNNAHENTCLWAQDNYLLWMVCPYILLIFSNYQTKSIRNVQAIVNENTEVVKFKLLE